MTQPFHIVIADGLASEGAAKLRALSGVKLSEHAALDRDELKRLLPEVDLLIVRSRTQVDRDLLEHAARLKVVLRAGIGLDNVDVPAATDRGIVVMNAPSGNIVTTAEHTLAMIFAVSRHIAQADATLRKGKWEKKKFQGNELRGKHLGLLGMGNIGKAVAERALALGMRVLAHDPFVTREVAAKHGITLLSFDDLLRDADYLSIHVPLTPSTKGLIGAEELRKMKKGAYLVNCARGGIVDENALLETLNAGHLAGAALDVFETEPLPSTSPLLQHEKLVLTPHLGASTDEAQILVGLEVAEQVSQYVTAGVLKNAINVPNISAEQLSVLAPHLNLCEKLGSFATQIAPTKEISRIKVRFEGNLGSSSREILLLSVLKGVLTPLMSTAVNFVNTRKLLQERGIRTEELYESECADYASLVEVTLEGKDSVTVAGTLFGKAEPRIVRVDGHNIDAVPAGWLLFTKNVDQPGVIGAIGTQLASQGVNIARMHLGRDTAKREAIAVINIDSAPSEETLKKLRGTGGMLVVRGVSL